MTNFVSAEQAAAVGFKAIFAEICLLLLLKMTASETQG